MPIWTSFALIGIAAAFVAWRANVERKRHAQMMERIKSHEIAVKTIAEGTANV